jgi:hypothetical protein
MGSPEPNLSDLVLRIDAAIAGKHSVIPSAELSRRGFLSQGSGSSMRPPVVIGGWVIAPRRVG